MLGLPDYANVMKRRVRTYKRYTAEQLKQKALDIGSANLELSQLIAFKRGEGWEGEEEQGSYCDLLSDVEFYIHCRRYRKEFLCLTCTKCPIKFFDKTFGKNNDCFNDVSEKLKCEVQTYKIDDIEYVSSCPLYEKCDDRKLYEDYIASPLWAEIRKCFLAETPYCEACGKEEGLTVHHKSYDHLCWEDVYYDCAVLCGNCHMELHKDPEEFVRKTGIIIPAHKRNPKY